MKKPLPRQSRQQKMGNIPMTPMIDIVFQLLIYFVLTFEIADVDTHVQVNHPGTTEPKSHQSPPHKVQVAADGFFYINGVRMTLERIETVLEQIAAVDPAQTLLITCMPKSQHGRLVHLLNVCAKWNLSNLSVASPPGR